MLGLILWNSIFEKSSHLELKPIYVIPKRVRVTPVTIIYLHIKLISGTLKLILSLGKPFASAIQRLRSLV